MLKINKISERTLVFTKELEEWDLHISIIMGDQHNFIIDTGLGSDHIQEIIGYIKKNNSKEIIVINSHYHWDHIWGNDACKEYPIISHELCYQILDERWDKDYKAHKDYRIGDVKKYLPTQTFTNTLEFKEDGIILFHTPGHTKDGISIYDKVDNIMHIIDNIGDNLEELLPSLEVSMDEYYEGLLLTKSYGARLYTCGHNQVIDNDIFEELINEVNKNRNT